MVVQGPLDFNLLLRHDYVYVMGDHVSSLFHVVCFLHEGLIVTIDQMSFISHWATTLPPLSPIGSYLQEVPSPPQVNYVATHSISTSADDHTDGIVHYVLGALEPDLSLVLNDMYSSRSVVLPSIEDLLGAMFSYGP